MLNGMQYDLIQGQGHKPFKVGNPAVFKSYLLCHLQWELATHHIFLNKGTISKFDHAGFLIFDLVFVSRDFEVGTNVSCEESTVSPRTGLIFSFWLSGTLVFSPERQSARMSTAKNGRLASLASNASVTGPIWNSGRKWVDGTPWQR